jgi:hypothetical protein
MKYFRACLIVVLIVFIAGTLIPCSAQGAKANAGTDVQTHKFMPKGPVGQVSPQSAQAMAAQTPAGRISATAMAQIAALQQEKLSRTPVQKKIDSQVLATVRMMQNQPVAQGIQYVYTDVDLDQEDNLVVDLTADVTDDLMKQMTAAGAKIIYSNAKYRSVRAAVPATAIETVASLPGVMFVDRKQEAKTVGIGGAPARYLAGNRFLATGFVQRGANVQALLAPMLAMRSPFAPLLSIGPQTNVYNSGQGSKVTEGDVAHRAVDARNAFGINGAGLKIGVLSDGVTNLALSQASGDLGSVTVLPGQTGSGDEGTAMLEIIHDLAPGAQLYFATAFNGSASFAQNIHDLRTAGCDIIVDDVFYSGESPFQDGQGPLVVSPTNGGLIAQAVNDVTAAGAMYFSSTGNGGNLDDGTSGTWEGDFVNGGTLPTLIGPDAIHQFGSNLYDTITVAGSWITLYWADPLGGPASDYDLYVLNSAGTAIVAHSTNDQSVPGSDPYEFVGTQVVAGDQIVVSKFSGNDRFFHLDTNGGGLAVATAGQAHGHSTALNAFGVAATPAVKPIYSNFPMGPYPGYFVSTNVVEGFSSDGPRRLFFNADGTAITPGNFSSTGGLVRQKPDITAADGVSVTGVGGFPTPFYGTSAAAPHAAAIAALVKSAKPSLTNAQLRTTLTSTAIDIMGAGVDRDSGAGILDAFAAVRSLGVTGFANPDIGNVTATDNPGNGNGAVEAGEGGSLVVQLKNTGGVADATNITATLTSSTPGVFIPTPNTAAYANLTALTGTGNNLSPFTFTLASDYPCGQPVTFTLTLNYTGGPSPRVLTFDVATGPPSVTSTVLDTTAPVVVAPMTAATGTQNTRLNRNGIASVCGTVKPFPNLAGGTSARQYDAYSFTACRSVCAQITTTTTADPGVHPIFTAAYTPTYTPGDISAGYAGDAGGSNFTTQFGIDMTAGTSYTVVAHEVNSGGAVGQSYSVQIPGCAVTCATPNHVPVAVAHDVTVTATSSGTAAASVNNGSSDADGDTLTITQAPPGPYSIGTTPVVLTVVDTKGATAQASATITVLKPDFGFTGTIPTTTVKAGQPGTQQITITPNPAPFTTAITLTCSGAPTSSTCSLSPATITPGSNPGTSTLNITTTGSSSAQLLLRRTTPIYASLALSGLGLVGLIAVGKQKCSGKVRVAVTLSLLILMSLALTNCGGGSKSLAQQPPPPPTPAGTYTLTVTATSGTTSHTTTATLIVQ